MNKEPTTMNMSLEGCMSTWVMRGHNPMGIDKERRRV